MNQQPDFIEFAAIQIFAALTARRAACDNDYHLAWKHAKMLFDAKPMPADQGIKPQMDIIIKRMQEKSDLAWTWHCNIAMAFADEGGPIENANRAAARFMKAAFNVDTSQSDEWKKTIEPYVQPKRSFQVVVDQEGNHAIYEDLKFVLELVSGEFFECDMSDMVQRKLGIPIGTALRFHFNYIEVDVVDKWPESFNEALILDA
jgi:hypothetical protein